MRHRWLPLVLLVISCSSDDRDAEAGSVGKLTSGSSVDAGTPVDERGDQKATRSEDSDAGGETPSAVPEGAGDGGSAGAGEATGQPDAVSATSNTNEAMSKTTPGANASTPADESPPALAPTDTQTDGGTPLEPAAPNATPLAESSLSPDGAAGAEEWITRLDETGLTTAVDVAADTAGNAYVVGHTLINRPTAPQLVKYSADGVQEWSERLAPDNDQQATAGGVATGPNDDVYASAVLSQGWPNLTGIINRYDTDGSLIWTTSLDVLDATSPAGLAVDAEGTLFAVGSAYAFLDDGGLGPQQGFVVAYSIDGEPQWSQTWQDGVDSFATAVAVTAAGDLFISGDSAHLLTKFDRDGNLLWQRAGTSGSYGWDVATDNQGQVYVLASSSAGALLQAFDTDGQPLWNEQWTATDGEFVVDVATDPFGNVFATSSVFGDTRTAELRKFDTTGELLWIQESDANASYTADGVAVAGTGHVFVTGSVFTLQDDGTQRADVYLQHLK